MGALLDNLEKAVALSATLAKNTSGAADSLQGVGGAGGPDAAVQTGDNLTFVFNTDAQTIRDAVPTQALLAGQKRTEMLQERLLSELTKISGSSGLGGNVEFRMKGGS